jgi:cation diffusion facilitator CzcD-associated flavoprotein CzcO
VDTRNVDCVRKNGGFHLTLADGEQIKASRVVVATGQAPFRRRPQQFDGLPSALASHSSEHSDFAPFKHRRVAVIGAGQSALESAALLHEAGAEVELLVRNPQVHWLANHLGQIGPVTRLLWVKAGVNRLAAHPNYFRYLPRYFHEKYAALRPAGSDWLQPRVEGKIPITTGRVVASAKRMKDELELTLDDGSQRVVDHVLLATGYSIDISRYEFLAAPLLAGIATVRGFPYLNAGFECSVPGLHFAGAPASWSFGPLMRFVAGAECAAHAIARRAVQGPAATADRARVLPPSVERNTTKSLGAYSS